MSKMINYIWWIIVIMILPLDGASIIYYIAEEIFNASFWILVCVYILLCTTVGIRLCIMENRKDK